MKVRIGLIGYGWLAKLFHLYLDQNYSNLELLVTNTKQLNPTSFSTFKNKTVPKRLELKSDNIEGDLTWVKEQNTIFCFITPTEYYSQQVKQILFLLQSAPKTRFVLISSTGVLPSSGSFSEDSVFEATSERSKRLKNAEDEVLKLANGFVLRSSGQIGPNRYPAKFLAMRDDNEIEDGMANIIHSDDLVRILELYLVEESLEKLIHAVSPYHPLKSQFYTEQAKRLGISLPSFSPARLEKIVNSEVLKRRGFIFKNAACI